ncbi:hypothetical protein D3C81_2234520 [compost metagenome]
MRRSTVVIGALANQDRRQPERREDIGFLVLPIFQKQGILLQQIIQLVQLDGHLLDLLIQRPAGLLPDRFQVQDAAL